MSTPRWPRLAYRGVCWAAIYNVIWGVAWFAFMRREWLDAFASLGQPLAWTSDVWLVWTVMTVPLGVAIVAYADGRPRVVLSAVRAGAALLFVFALGMTVWGIQASLSLRVLALDALVNAVAIPIASILSAAGLPPHSGSSA